MLVFLSLSVSVPGGAPFVEFEPSNEAPKKTCTHVDGETKSASLFVF